MANISPFGKMPTILSIEQIHDLFQRHGHRRYAGEPVTQLQHALQTAALAQKSGASTSLVCAALLHDLGHLIDDSSGTPTQQGIDDLHQYRVLPLLRKLLGPDVLEPIRLHVDAKRYLCAIDFEYYLHLSADSKLSLKLQGGVLTPEKMRAFEANPFHKEGVQLRRWDDLAKSPSMKTPDLNYFMAIVESCVLKNAVTKVAVP